MSSQVFILSGCRTAIGNFQGQFDKLPATELGSVVIAEAVKRASLTPEDVDQVIIGQVLVTGQGQNPARQSAVGARIPYTVPAFTINMLCGSGLKSVCLAYLAIRNEDNEIIVAGGQENMSRAHHSSYIRGNKFGNVQFNDTLISDGLTDAFYNIPMGKTAEHLANKFKITREDQDKYVVESQTKAGKAINEGHFAKELVAVVDKKTGKVLDKDEFPKPETSLEALAKLRPAFDSKGTVTAGNSSGINDGAAALVLCSEKQVKLRGLKPLARLVAFSEVGVDPMDMGLGPIDAVKKVLAKAGWTQEDVDLYELSEAFAVQCIAVLESLPVDKRKVNVSGGALALGHPIGASGARILVTLLHNLERLNKKRGVASLCVGGGMGIAIAVEMC